MVVLLPAKERQNNKITLIRSKLLKADRDAAFVTLSFSVETAWGRTLVADIFELHWQGQDLVVTNHGAAARARLAARG